MHNNTRKVKINKKRVIGLKRTIRVRRQMIKWAKKLLSTDSELDSLCVISFL